MVHNLSLHGCGGGRRRGGRDGDRRGSLPWSLKSKIQTKSASQSSHIPSQRKPRMETIKNWRPATSWKRTWTFAFPFPFPSLLHFPHSTDSFLSTNKYFMFFQRDWESTGTLSSLPPPSTIAPQCSGTSGSTQLHNTLLCLRVWETQLVGLFFTHFLPEWWRWRWWYLALLRHRLPSFSFRGEGGSGGWKRLSLMAPFHGKRSPRASTCQECVTGNLTKRLLPEPHPLPPLPRVLVLFSIHFMI